MPVPEVAELVPGFRAETDQEREVTGDPELLAGLAWGKPRESHPEGSVGAHVADLLRVLDEWNETGERRRLLRFAAIVHDSLKYRVRGWLPKTGRNHHASRARRFAERYTRDERVLATIELHDQPYHLWKAMKRKGRLQGRRFERMMRRVPDPALFVRFIELDGATEGKDPAPIEWLRDELERRGHLEREAPAG
jgi:hypothetical protein